MKPTKKNPANEISDLMNNMMFDYEGFCKEMSNHHRTLQQSFTKLCFEWIKYCASDEYRSDPRNQHAKNMCKEVVNAYNNDHTRTSELTFDNIYFPFI